MAKCEYCGKDVSFGIKVSHSHRRSNRTWKPNIKRGQGYSERLSQESLCMYSLPSFRQSYTRCLMTEQIFTALF